MLDKRKLAEQSAQTFTRRALFIAGAQCCVAGALGARMYQLQVIESGYYSARAERSRIQPKLIAPVRGEIFARNGEPLAVNRQNYRVVMIREQTDDPRATLEALAQIMDLPPERIDKLTAELERTSPFLPVLVGENLSWRQFAQINANAPALPGVASELGLTRHYPEAEIASHVVGYVAAASEADIKRAEGESRVLKLPGMRIGKNGVERALETDLRGKAGLSRVEKNVHGRTIRELQRQEGAPGRDLTLTVDLKLQDYAMRRLGRESGSAVVMDIYNGDLLALASAPGFDPNGFVLGLSGDAWRALDRDPLRPLTNKAIADQYPPGSTFKMVVALAALHEGVIGPRHSVFCGGHMRLGRRRFHCWKRGGHGHMDMVDGIKQSCDVYFYDIAKRIGVDRIAAMARTFGLGVSPGIELPQAAEGLVPDVAWKRAFRGEAWHVGETLIAGIGQGYLLATPLQLAIMTARIANGGYLVRPRIVRARGGVEIEPAPLEGAGVSERHIDIVRQAMFGVCNEVGGTARSSRIVAAGYEMSGKTGTAQVREITKAERATGVLKNEELPWRLRDHALFVAFAPAHAPRYAVAVVVEHGGGGSTAAAPIARDVMLHTMFRDEPPDDAVPANATPIHRFAAREQDA